MATSNLVREPAQPPAPSARPAKPARRKFDLREKPQLWLVPTVFVVVVLAWEYGVQLIGVDEYVLPLPSSVVESLWQQLGDDQFWGHFWVTTQEALLGFVIGVGAALLLGTFISQIKIVEATLMPYIVAFQTVPKVALAPLFVVWFGFGLTSKVVMAAVISFFPMLVNVIEGLRAADADKIQMLTVFGASKTQIFRMVRLPSALPFIFAGLDIGIVFAILGAVVGEFIGAKEGLGYLLLQTNYNFDIAGMFAVLVVLSVMGLVAHFVIRLLQKRLAFWAEDTKVIGA
ncbi:ABC transporter permease [Micromonospora aurantiaca]|uniref:ABC transporter permease n=1 Tax=Micromonospora aurantiaca (nom. illeg.) TaxID=47850 RepID=A0A6N3K827_9ACTN|nr:MULTISPECIES: ABC transporter permease [Micromonospora]AXH93183.1 ABC transporter permease [Micromonospora aurantiaca]KAB1118556.1 ABC transporter permease [Micromonospora aurantiaca]MDG4752242.1 ABC transporter permease [Micromonospora sp. WMMD718]MDW3848604.1 ABC transporter permease [Micromonospora sp. BRA006-A]OHX01767.1 ABC transporter permease [Micromonospora sp. WMMB235]